MSALAVVLDKKMRGRHTWARGTGEGGDAHSLTLSLVSPPPCGHFKTTQ